MDTREVADAIERALERKFPGIVFTRDLTSYRENTSFDFYVAVAGDKGTITIELEPEELTCIECSGLMSGAENLVPVTDGEAYEVACQHNLPKLRHWRELTPEERKDFDQGAEALEEALKDASKPTQEADHD